MNVLVLGANGQLGRCIKDAESKHNSSFLNFVYKSREECDITSESSILDAIKQNSIDAIVNCAAFVNVSAAEEDEQKKAYEVNTLGPMMLANICEKQHVLLIHISTDFVFDGMKGSTYKENDKCNPLNVYGMSKFLGEKAITSLMNGNYYIIRTSWLFSKYCNNSFKKMVEYITAGENLYGTTDEIGKPTSAKDLADFIIWLLVYHSTSCFSNIIHFCNAGVASRYDVAYEIAKYFGKTENLKETKMTPPSFYNPKRPKMNVLENTVDEKIYKVRHWREALKEYLDEYCKEYRIDVEGKTDA